MLNCVIMNKNIKGVHMKPLKNILKNACVYTVIISFLFAFVGLFALDKNASIPIGQFFIIMLFGLFISLGQCVLNFNKVKPFIRYLIHFSILYISFICTFYLTGKITTKGASGFLVSTILFVFAYLFVILLRYLTTIVCKKQK